MTSEERLRILGPATVAEIHARVSLAPPAPPETIEAIRSVLAPAMQRVLSRRATECAPQPLAA